MPATRPSRRPHRGLAEVLASKPSTVSVQHSNIKKGFSGSSKAYVNLSHSLPRPSYRASNVREACLVQARPRGTSCLSHQREESIKGRTRAVMLQPDLPDSLARLGK
jgi:hypothetical protein